MGRYLEEDWTQIEHELLRERGLWGPNVGSRLDKWMLDMTEGNFHVVIGLMKKVVKLLSAKYSCIYLKYSDTLIPYLTSRAQLFKASLA